MALGDVEHDGPRLEQDELAFLVGRDLAERMQRQVRRLLHRPERNQANLVGLAHLFQRPANARVARQSLAAVGRAFKGGDGDGHREAGRGAPAYYFDSSFSTRVSSALTRGSSDVPRSEIAFV